MPRLQLTTALGALSLLGAGAFAAACGTTTKPPGLTESTATSTGTSTSTSSQGGGGSGGAGGSEQGGGGSGTGAGGMLEGCGDGKIIFPEQCDGADLNGKTCVDYGFEAGTLGCNVNNCQVDVSKCTKKELCSNGIDDDVNNLIDCQDPDCTDACADSCAPASIVPAPSAAFPFQIMGFTTGHANKLHASCSASGGTKSGPEIVYAIIAAQTGVLDLAMQSSVDMGISVRTQCAQADELGCADDDGPGATERLVVPVTQGQEVFVIVQGHAQDEAGIFTLVADNRKVLCGDGFTDGNEQCDDHNSVGGDGCSAVCKVESKETEPNNTAVKANPYSAPWFASISPAGDVDMVKVVVASFPSTIHAEVKDFDGHSCTDGLLDSNIEILEADGVTVKATADDMGMSACSAASYSPPVPGTYFVRVTASPVAVHPTFAYKLDVQVSDDICGNGAVSGNEECDDGNLLPNDGCSPACLFEPSEVEPNATPMTANVYKSPWHGAINPAGDVDMVAVTVGMGESIISASVVDDGNGDCMMQKIVSRLEIIGTNGSTVLVANEGNGDYCAGTSIENLAPGKYYVRVKAGPLAPNATFSYGLQIVVL
jgi:cysteine-rich repeat protein